MAKDILSGGISTTDTNFLPLIIGFIFAFFTGMFACKWMIKLVKNSQLKYFAYYCFAIGSIVIATSLL
jgi:undecaprenyl-diphosphatase